MQKMEVVYALLILNIALFAALVIICSIMPAVFLIEFRTLLSAFCLANLITAILLAIELSRIFYPYGKKKNKGY